MVNKDVYIKNVQISINNYTFICLLCVPRAGMCLFTGTELLLGEGVNGTAEINVLQDVAYGSNKAGLRRERSKLRNEIARR